MDRFADEAEGRIQEFSQQNLANMAWAFGKLTHDAPSLLDAIGLKATTIVTVCSSSYAVKTSLSGTSSSWWELLFLRCAALQLLLTPLLVLSTDS